MRTAVVKLQVLASEFVLERASMGACAVGVHVEMNPIGQLNRYSMLLSRSSGKLQWRLAVLPAIVSRQQKRVSVLVTRHLDLPPQ